MQRVKRSKGLNVLEVHLAGLGYLKNISHPSLFHEEGPSCCVLLLIFGQVEVIWPLLTPKQFSAFLDTFDKEQDQKSIDVIKAIVYFNNLNIQEI